MSHWYRYEGARPHRRDDGTVVTQSEVFEATDREHERWVRRNNTLFTPTEPVAPVADVAQDETPPPKDDAPGVGDPAEDETEDEDAPLEFEEWTLRMSPSRYLKVHPDGPNAELARALVGEE